MHIDHALNAETLKPQLASAFEAGMSQLAQMIQKWPAGKPAPIYTEKGIWTRPATMWTDWCPGFYAGMMWLAFERTGEAAWQRRAIEYTETLENRKFDRDVHDLGFIFMSTVERWHNVLPEDDPERRRLQDIIKTAGTVQSFRWQGVGENHYLYSFNGPQSLFIDIMMNIRLLFRAHQFGASDTLYQKAVTHARTTEKYLIQKDGPRLMDADGAAIHEGIFNPQTGEFRNLSTQQGYSPFTCWARGLAWAIYGFTDTYLFTGDAFFLETAERCADFYLRNTPDSGVPFWDYGAPNLPNEPVDSSAAAIAAGGFWKLQQITGTRRNAADYKAAALQILNSLCNDDYLGARQKNYQGILRHGVYHLPMRWGVDESVMWGDYFFMEALHRVLSQ